MWGQDFGISRLSYVGFRTVFGISNTFGVRIVFGNSIIFGVRTVFGLYWVEWYVLLYIDNNQ